MNLKQAKRIRQFLREYDTDWRDAHYLNGADPRQLARGMCIIMLNGDCGKGKYRALKKEYQRGSV